MDHAAGVGRRREDKEGIDVDLPDRAAGLSAVASLRPSYMAPDARSLRGRLQDDRPLRPLENRRPYDPEILRSRV